MNEFIYLPAAVHYRRQTYRPEARAIHAVEA